MADRRRRRRNSSNTESEYSEGEENVAPQPRGSTIKERECESEFTTGGEETSECDSYTEGGEDDEETETDEDDETTEDFDDDDDDVIIEGDDWIEEERQSGDGEEEPDKHVELDDDEDKKNPAYIPRKGAFYEHDTRISEEGGKEEGEPASETQKPKPALWQDHGKWLHDRYTSDHQAPKSREEIVAIYGYDIRAYDKPPDIAPRGNKNRRRNPRDRKQFGDFLPGNDGGGDRNYNRGYSRGGRGSHGYGTRGRGSGSRGGSPRFNNIRDNGGNTGRSYTEYKNNQNMAESSYGNKPREPEREVVMNKSMPPDVVPKTFVAEVNPETDPPPPGQKAANDQGVRTRFRRGGENNAGNRRATENNGYNNKPPHNRDNTGPRSNNNSYNPKSNYNSGRGGGFGPRRDDNIRMNTHSDRRVPPMPPSGGVIRQPMAQNPRAHIPPTTATNVRPTHTNSTQRPKPNNQPPSSIYPPVTQASGDVRLAQPKIPVTSVPDSKNNRPITDQARLSNNDRSVNDQQRPKRYSSQRQRPNQDNQGYPGDGPASPDPTNQQPVPGSAPNTTHLVHTGHSYYPQQVFGQPTNVFARGPRPTTNNQSPPASRSFPQPPMVQQAIPSVPFSIPVTSNVQSPPRLQIQHPPLPTPTSVTTSMPEGPPNQPLLPAPPLGVPAFVSPPGPTVAVNYGPPGAPPPQGPPSHFQMATPLPLAPFPPPAALSKPPAFPPAPPPPQLAPQLPPVPTQVPVTGPDPIHIHGGTTYYSPEAQPYPTPGPPTGTTYFSPHDQQPSPSRTPVTRRPKAAIPIINPQMMSHGVVGEYVQDGTEGEQYEYEYADQESELTYESSRDLAQESNLSAMAQEFHQKCVTQERVELSAEEAGSISQEAEPSQSEVELANQEEVVCERRMDTEVESYSEPCSNPEGDKDTTDETNTSEHETLETETYTTQSTGLEEDAQEQTEGRATEQEDPPPESPPITTDEPSPEDADEPNSDVTPQQGKDRIMTEIKLVYTEAKET